MTAIEIHTPTLNGWASVQLQMFETVSEACAFAKKQRELGHKHIVVRGPDLLSSDDLGRLEALGIRRL